MSVKGRGPGMNKPDEASGAKAAGERKRRPHSEFQGAHATDTLDSLTILRGEVTLIVGDTEAV
jgi:hypothetical protein